MPLSLDGTTGISASGNIVGNNISVSGTLSAGTFSPASLSASGNLTGGNLVTSGIVTATGNLIAGNILTAGIMSSTGNGIHGNILTAGLISATSTITSAANVVGGNITTAGLITATGNITGGNLSGTNITGTLLTASQTNITAVGTLTSLNSGAISSSGNVTGLNFLTAGIMSSTGNAIHGNILTAGLISATSNMLTAGIMSSTGNGIHGNILTAGLISATSNMLTAGYITATGNVLGNVFTVNLGNTAGAAIVNGGGNGVGNIGSSTGYFNTAHVKATSAQYADLAELYEADKQLDAGHVVEFGGEKEIQKTTISHSTRVAGIVSTQPSYLMNATNVEGHATAVALTGRVPCYVVGTISKGDRLVASDIPGVATILDMQKYQPGCIIGKALQDYNSADIGKIEVAVGRF